LDWEARSEPSKSLFLLRLWWRRRESNPRPQALRPRLYMLSPPFVLTASNPTDRARSTASPLDCLTTRRRTRFVASLSDATPEAGRTSTAPVRRHPTGY